MFPIRTANKKLRVVAKRAKAIAWEPVNSLVTPTSAPDEMIVARLFRRDGSTMAVPAAWLKN